MPREEFRKRKSSDEIKCYKCHKTGHIAAKCPNLQELYAEKECLYCRQKGHGYRFCPNNVDVGDVRCYTCGKSGHASRNCTMNKNDNDKYRFAECFICKGVGHLASQCPENKTKSIYPRGGSCFNCGGTDHLSRHCPNKTEEERAAERMERFEKRKEEGSQRKLIGSKHDDIVDLDEDESKGIKSKGKAESDERLAKKAKRKHDKDDVGGGLVALAQELNASDAGIKKKSKKSAAKEASLE